MRAPHFPSWCGEDLVLIVGDSFFIIAFAEYVDSQGDFSQSFSSWLKVSLPVH